MWIEEVAHEYNLGVLSGEGNYTCRDNTRLCLNSKAVFNDDGTNRYILEKSWSTGEKSFLAFMMNPSRASHLKSDVTVNQMIELAKVYCCDKIHVVNVSSLINGSSNDVPDESFNFNDTNWAFIEKALNEAYMIHIAWGVKGQKGINPWFSLNKVSEAFYSNKHKFHTYETLTSDKEKLYYVPHPRPRGEVKKYETSLGFKLNQAELADLFGR